MSADFVPIGDYRATAYNAEPCVVCGRPVDIDRAGAVKTQLGTYAHDTCARWLASWRERDVNPPSAS